MKKRYFDVAEANRLVPVLEQAFQRVLWLQAQLHRVTQTLHRLGDPWAMEAPDRDTTDEPSLEAEGEQAEPDSPEIARTRGFARGLLEVLDEELRRIETLGVQVKDPEIGLCDFLARWEGRDVLLCWRLGEKRVDHWHEVRGGFSGRRRIDPAMAAPDRLVH